MPDEFIPGPCRVSLKQVILLDELIAFTDTDAVVCTSVDVVLHEVGIADTILEADGGVLDASFFVCGTDTNTNFLQGSKEYLQEVHTGTPALSSNIVPGSGGPLLTSSSAPDAPLSFGGFRVAAWCFTSVVLTHFGSSASS